MSRRHRRAILLLNRTRQYCRQHGQWLESRTGYPTLAWNAMTREAHQTAPRVRNARPMVTEWDKPGPKEWIYRLPHEALPRSFRTR